MTTTTITVDSETPRSINTAAKAAYDAYCAVMLELEHDTRYLERYEDLPVATQLAWEIAANAALSTFMKESLA